LSHLFDITAALPEGKKVVIVAPNNAAFDALLTKLGVTAEELIASDLFVPTLATHLAVATNNGASQADTVAGSKIRLYQGEGTTTKLPLLNVAPGVGAGTNTVQGPMNKATSLQTINCNGNNYVFAVDTVLEPKEIAGVLTPTATAPETLPVVPDVPMMPDVPVIPAITPVPDVVEVAPSPEPMPMPSPSPMPMPSPSPEPMPMPSPMPVPVVAPSSATGLKAALGSAMAVVAAMFM